MAEHNERTRIVALEEESKLRPVILEKFPERVPEFDLALQELIANGVRKFLLNLADPTPECAIASNTALAGRTWTSSIAS